MHAGSRGDLLQIQARHSESDHLLMVGRAGSLDSVPELSPLRHLAGPRRHGIRQSVGFAVLKWLFPFDPLAMLLVAVSQASLGHAPQKGLQVGAVLEMPTLISKPLEDVGVDRLENVLGIDLDAETATEAPADRDPQVRLIGAEDVVDRGRITGVQSLDPPFDRLVAHGSPVDFPASQPTNVTNAEPEDRPSGTVPDRVGRDAFRSWFC